MSDWNRLDLPKSELSKMKEAAVCAICGLPALTVAPVKPGVLIGGCAKHPEQVLAAMKKSSTIALNRRERKLDMSLIHRARTSVRGILKEHRKKTY